MAQLPLKKVGFQDFALGATATIAAKTAVAPLERAKLIMQCQVESKVIASTGRPYKGLFDVLHRVRVSTSAKSQDRPTHLLWK